MKIYVIVNFHHDGDYHYVNSYMLLQSLGCALFTEHFIWTRSFKQQECWKQDIAAAASYYYSE